MNSLQIKEYFTNSENPIILDGAIGSLIQQRGFKIDADLWTSILNIEKPSVIIDIHKEYIKSGCDVITTNTFRTNPSAINKSKRKLKVENFVKLSVELSRNVANEHNVILAGSNPPAEDCYNSIRTLPKYQLEFNHHKHIELLYSNGADFILNETQSHLDEIEIISKYCSDNSVPFVLSLLVTSELNILSGENIFDVIKIIKSYSPLLISVNCINSKVFSKLLNNIEIDFNWGFYLNCCKGNYFSSNIICDIDEDSYVDIVKSSLILKPKLIGACCGSKPTYISRIKQLFNETINS